MRPTARSFQISPTLLFLSVVAAAAPAGALTVAIGDPVPDFSGEDHDNQTFTLSDEQGKVVLLHFCRVICGPCVQSADAEEDLIAAIDDEIGAENWTIVDVLYEGLGITGLASERSDAISWRTKTLARTVHASGSTGSAVYQYVLELDLGVIPAYFVVAPDGVLAAIHLGFAQGIDEELLFEAVVAASPFAPDHDPPVIAAKKTVVVETKTGPVAVKYAKPTATDAKDGIVAVSCLPASGSLFPFGRTSVECSASDQAGNDAESSFTVQVGTPTTPGAVTNPGNLGKPLVSLHLNREVRVTAGGFEPGATVELSFVTSALESIELGETLAGDHGRIDVRLKVPQRAPRGVSQFTALGLAPDGGELVRAWVLPVEGGPAS